MRGQQTVGIKVLQEGCVMEDSRRGLRRRSDGRERISVKADKEGKQWKKKVSVNVKY
jgi:hypothetical protein